MTRTSLAVAALAALAVLHGAFFGWWVVDDASISFAYARNWANGHGLVAWVGGERVEGYSNFTWTALLALGELLGLDARLGAKILSFAFAAATVPVLARLGARAVPTHPREAGLLAAALFATFAQTGIFTAAGLENPLFTFLLALGLLWADEEAGRVAPGHDPWPRSAVAWLLLAMTRPEGIVYAAAAGAFALLAAVRARAGAGWIARWLAVFFLPFGAYHAIRYAYFAWPFPMTYYAKVQHGPEMMVAWNGSGWGYVRSFWAQSGMAWFAPAALIGAVGLAPRGNAERAALVVVAAGAFALAPSAWLGGPARALALLAIAGVTLAFAARDTVRGPAWAAVVLASLFAVNAGGDWMGGFRWMSLAAAPLCLLLSAGLVELAFAFLPRPRHAAALLAGVAVAFAAVNLPATLAFRANPEISPDTVLRRARVIEAFGERLAIDGPVRVLTYDMGGFLWASDLESHDAMGLVDVPVALHKRRFDAAMRMWVFEELRPHFVAIPLPLIAELKRGGLEARYVRITPDMWARRDLLFAPAWGGPAFEPRAYGAASIEGFALPAAEVRPGFPLRVHLGVRAESGAGLGARFLLRRAGEAPVASWPVELGYGWAPPQSWDPGEVFRGTWSLEMPADLPPGDFELGVQLTQRGRPLPGPDGSDTAWLAAVRLGDPDAVRAAATAAAERALDLAGAGSCDDAEEAWRSARAHGAAGVPDARRALAACRLARGELEQARAHDPAIPDLQARLAERARALHAEGLAARARGDLSAALRAFTAAVALDPTRSWSRRRAEEARAAILSATPETERRPEEPPDRR